MSRESNADDSRNDNPASKLRRGRGRRPDRMIRPLIPNAELLEIRIVPLTAYVVTNTSNTGVSGDGSLAGEILAAESFSTRRMATPRRP